MGGHATLLTIHNESHYCLRVPTQACVGASASTSDTRQQRPNSGGSTCGHRTIQRPQPSPSSSFGLESVLDWGDDSPVSLEVSLEDLLGQVGAGTRRNADGRVQIEANPHPSVLSRYIDLTRPFEKGRALPIPMPHKLNRPLPLPRSRSRLLRSLARPNLSPLLKSSPSLHSKLLAKLQATPYDQVPTVLDSWRGKSKSKSIGLGNVILELGRRTCVDKALQMYAWVRQQPQFWPDENYILAIAQVAVESGMVHVANNLVAMYGPLSSESLRRLADVYVEHGHLRDAVEVLQSSGREGLCVDADMYVKLIVRAGRAGAKQFVQVLLEGRHFPLQMEDCTKVMAACSKVGLIAEVEALFQLYTGKGFKPNIVMYTTLMKARSRAGKSREAVGLFWELEREGITPDLVAYRVMIELCDKLGDLAKAVKVYNHMKATGFMPSLDVYNILIRMYCKDGRRAKARDLIREMETLGCAPTAKTRAVLVEGPSHL